jgi:DeoR/GlpR family transcriptional regulator of sugar metabolism
MLAGDEVVFLDAGTTAHAVADAAHRKPNCTYVTTCLGVANRLQSLGIQKFFLVGGSYQKVNDSFAGTLAISALGMLSFDIAFVCCSAIDASKRSISIASEIYSSVQRQVVSSSRKTVVIADHTKFKGTAFVRTAEFHEISGIITSRELDAETAAQVRNSRTELVLV